MKNKRFNLVYVIKTFGQSLFVMLSYTVEMVSNASAQLIPDIIFNSFTNGATVFGQASAGCNFEIMLPISETKFYTGKVHVF